MPATPEKKKVAFGWSIIFIGNEKANTSVVDVVLTLVAENT
jgi:hypothetical protein